MLAWKLHLSFQIDRKLDYQKEEVIEVKESSGIPKGFPEETETGTEMIFNLNAKVGEDEKKDDPMWSFSSTLPSAWLFDDE